MEGGDLIFKDYKFGVNKSGDRPIFPDVGTTKSTASIVSFLTCFLFGCFSLKLFDFTQAGVVNFVLVGVVLLLLSQLSFSLFIRTWRYSKENNYADIFRDAFDVNPIVVSLLIIIASVSMSVSYSGKIISAWKSLFKPFVSDGNIVLNDYIIGYVLCGILPVVACSTGTFNIFFPLSYIANICAVLATVPLFIEFGKSVKSEGFDPTKQVKIVTGKFWLTIDVTKSFVTLFFAHFFIKFAAKFAVHKTQKSIEKITWAANTINTVYNLVCIIIGYFNYTNNFPGMFYFDAMDPKSALAMLAKISAIINLTIANAGYYKLFTDQVITIFSTSDTIPVVSIISNATVAVLSIGAAIMGGHAASVIDIAGSISFIIVIFIIPAVIYLRMYKLSCLWGYTAIFLLVIVLAILALTSYRSITKTFY